VVRTAGGADAGWRTVVARPRAAFGPAPTRAAWARLSTGGVRARLSTGGVRARLTTGGAWARLGTGGAWARLSTGGAGARLSTGGPGRRAAVRSGRKPSRSWPAYPIVSIMCSTVEGRLAMIGKAIDEVAAAASEGTRTGAGLDDLTARLAAIWAMLAELDPALAGRLRDYALDGE